MKILNDWYGELAEWCGKKKRKSQGLVGKTSFKHK